MKKHCLTVLACLLAVACSGASNPPATDGGGGGTDGGGTIMFPADLPALSRGTMGMPMMTAADYSSCAASAAAPTPGAEIDIDFHLKYFGGEDGAPGATVWFYQDNVVRDSCEAGSCQELTTSDTGHAMVRALAGGWYAYRVFPRSDLPTSALRFAGSIQYNEPAASTAGATVEGNAVSEQTLSLIPAVLGFPRQRGTALMAGTVIDCTGEVVYGAIIVAFAPDGTPIVEGPLNPDPHFRYFDGDSTPSGESRWSHADGLFAAVNIPIPSDPSQPVRLEAWGRDSAGGPVRRLGCEAGRVLEDTVTILNVGPLRSDYPAGHPCAD